MRIKLPLTQIQYLREVPGFRSAGHNYKYMHVAKLGYEAVAIAMV